jgi:Tfp pilus assembly protein PilF
VASCFVIAALAGLVTVIPPHRGRAVVTVSRFGSSVWLLPAGVNLSLLPLARRLALARHEGDAVVTGRIALPLRSGAATEAPIQLQLSGAGGFPVRAEDVRRQGWEGSWEAWLSARIAVTAEQSDRILRASPLWTEIFPADAPEPPVDLTPQLAAAFAPLRLIRASVMPEVDSGSVRALARSELARRSVKRGHLVVLGLDALDWDIVDELVKRGLMPNIAQLLRQGAQAVEEVPAPLISPVVWTTIGTGEPPEVHGVLDFLEPNPAGGAPRPTTSASRRVPALWEMAAAAGRTTAVIGWWATYPAQAPPGGTVYSDRLTEQLLGLSSPVPRLADPPAAEVAANHLALHAADVTPAMLAPFLTVGASELAKVLARPDVWDDPIGGLAKLVAATLTVERLTSRELDRDTDVVFSYLEGTDTVGHLFGPYRPPALPTVDPALAARFAGVVDRYYAHVDGWVGAVAKRLGPEDTLVVVSDHGFAWGADRPRVPAGAHTATAVLWHRPEGVFLAAGPVVQPSPTRRRIGVIDVAPTLLALAGLPRGTEMPGRVPEWLLRSGDHRPGVDYVALLAPDKAPEVELPPQAAQEQLAKLRALGYIAGGEARPTDTQAPEPQHASVAPTVEKPRFDRVEARRLNNLAISRASSGDSTGAEQALRQAIAADPTFVSAHYSLSVVLRKSGDLDASDREFWLAVGTGLPDVETAITRLALDYRQRGDTARAIAAFTEGTRRFPKSARIWLNFGVYLGELSRFAKARQCLEKAVALDPTNPTAHLNLAVALLRLNETEAARRSLAEAVRLDPTNEQARAELERLGGSPPGR